MSRDCTDWAWSIEIKPATLKLVLLNLADRADNDGYECYPSIDRISKDTGLNKKTVQQNIIKLIDSGLLSDTGRRIGQLQRIRVLKLHPNDTKNGNNTENGTFNDTENGLINVPENGLQNQSLEPVNNNQSNTTKRFCKPTSGELASYMAELGFNTPEETATYFLDYYESKDWMIGKNRMKDWEAAVRTWKRKEKPQVTNQPDIPIQPIIDHYNKILGSTLNHKITLVSPQLTRDIAKRWNESSGPARKVEWWRDQFYKMRAKLDYIESPQYFPKRYQLEEFVGFQFEKVLNEIWS